MVNNDAQLNAVFGALSDPTRRSMLHHLRHGEQSVGQLAAPYDMSLAGAAKHVQVLEKAQLIRRRKEGRIQYCALNAEAFKLAQQWFETYSQFWNSRLDNLTTLLEQERESRDD